MSSSCPPIQLGHAARRLRLSAVLQASGGRRRYTTTTPPDSHRQGRHLHPGAQKPTTPSRPSPSVQPTTSPIPTPPGARHEVHEGTSVLSVPYNPPGGGPGGGPQGFTFTNSPVLDAILTTCIGLGAGLSNDCLFSIVFADFSP